MLSGTTVKWRTGWGIEINEQNMSPEDLLEYAKTVHEYNATVEVPPGNQFLSF